MIDQETMLKALEWRQELLNKKYEEFDRMYISKDQWVSYNKGFNKELYKGLNIELYKGVNDEKR
jgi:hypothetical protein